MIWTLNKMKRKSELKISLFSFQDIITSVTGVMILLTLLLAMELVEKVESSPPVQTHQITEELRARIDTVKNQVTELKNRIGQSNQEVVNLVNTSDESIESEVAELENTLDLLQDKSEKVHDSRKNLDHTKSQLEKAEISKVEIDSEIAALEKKIQDLKSRINRVNQGLVVLLEPRQGDIRAPWVIEVFQSRIIVSSIKFKTNSTEFKGIYELERWLKAQNSSRLYFFLIGHRGGFELLQKTRTSLTANGFDYGMDLLLDNQNAIKSQED